MRNLLPFFASLVACGGTVVLGGEPSDAGRPVLVPATVSSLPLGVVPSGTQAVASKVDVLLMVDNSGGMKEKQRILAASLPSFLNRLAAPNCVQPGVQSQSSVAGKCPTGFTLEFAPVTDLHLGVVSSSLGTLGSDSCLDLDTFNNNDRGELLTRAATNGFLAINPAAGLGAQELQQVQTLVSAVRDRGCGFEQSLESWYRFLVQPDPYEAVIVENRQRAVFSGINATILKQRAAFLRPDSLVVVLMLSDEDDASTDPLSIQGQGFNFMSTDFPGSTALSSSALRIRPSRLGGGTTAPRGTSLCATEPGSAGCNSCAFMPSDPGCEINGGFMTPEEDALNARFHRMKERYGTDPQFPLGRYTLGLSSTKVPSIRDEHDLEGNYRIDSMECDNPLFSSNLPTDPNADLCHLPAGPRSRSLVLFQVLGGAPPDRAEFSSSDSAGWEKLIGVDRVGKGIRTGQVPQMVQSIHPRKGMPTVAMAGENVVDRETGGTELQFACTFQLETPIAFTRGSYCEDEPKSMLCAKDGTQVRSQAYPSVRVFTVAQALEDRAIVGSSCPRDVGVDAPEGSKFYRPALSRLVDRMATALAK